MPKPLQVVHTADIAVTFDPNICRHAGECIRGLPKVFDVSRPDWIHPGAAWPEEILAVVARCPSGALQAVRAGLAPQKPVDLPLARRLGEPEQGRPDHHQGPGHAGVRHRQEGEALQRHRPVPLRPDRQLAVLRREPQPGGLHVAGRVRRH